MNFGSLSKAAGGLMSDIKAKAKEAAHDAADSARRATQQVLETAGVSDKADDDELPELKAHLRLDAYLRRLYKHSDGYLRKMNELCEASRLLSDDFAEALDAYPALRSMADDFAANNHAALAEQMQILTQMLHTTVFTPIRREVEGRKEIEKRIADRKKVRNDYDAYRRKQMHQIQTDPANSRQYEANLEHARQTYAKHSAMVAADLAAVAQERDTALAEAFMGALAGQTAFHQNVSTRLGEYVKEHAVAFDGSAALKTSWNNVSLQLRSFQANPKPPPPRASRSDGGQAKSVGPTSSGAGAGAGKRTGAEYTPPDLTEAASTGNASAARPPVPTQPQAPRPAPPPARTAPAAAEVDLLGGFAATPTPANGGARSSNGTPQSSPPPAPAPEVDLLGGGGFQAPPAAAPPPSASAFDAGFADDPFAAFGDSCGSTTGSVAGSANGSAGNSGSASIDLIGSGGGGGGSAVDLMMGGGSGGGGGSAMDDMLFELGAAAPLMPSAAAAPPAARARSLPDAAPPPVASRPFSTSVGGGLMDGMGDLMGASPTPIGGRPRPASMDDRTMRAGMASDPFGLDGPSVGGSEREYYAQRREAQKQEAIDAKVQQLKLQKEKESTNRDREQELNKTVKARVDAWQREKKNLRALLASLHEIAPPCAWQPVTLAVLLDPAAVKKSYRKALLAVHPDKQDPDDVEAKVLAQHVFDALRDAWNLFEKTG